MRVFYFKLKLKREVTKVLSTGGLESSVSGFDSHLPDKKVHWCNGNMLDCLSGATSSILVWTAQSIIGQKCTLY